jgi:23S rRNA maturation mini-RNase III
MSQAVPTESSALQDEIEQTRADLGDTVEALTTKINVTARTKDAMARIRSQAKTTVRHASARAGDHVRTALNQARKATTERGQNAQTQTIALRRAMRNNNLAATVAKPKPIVAIVGAAALIAAAIWLRRRRQS